MSEFKWQDRFRVWDREDGQRACEDIARRTAIEFGLDPRLICALCEVESSWMPWAVRHEAGHEWLIGFELISPGSEQFWTTANYEYRLRDAAGRLWQPQIEKLAKFEGVVVGDRATILTELLGQQTSWSLMQPMGGTMRERGFRGWLTELCDPAVNLEWGCKHLRWMIDHNNAYGLPDFRITPEDLAAAWNWGSRMVVDGKYANEDYVKRVRKAMEGYQ